MVTWQAHVRGHIGRNLAFRRERYRTKRSRASVVVQAYAMRWKARRVVEAVRGRARLDAAATVLQRRYREQKKGRTPQWPDLLRTIARRKSERGQFSSEKGNALSLNSDGVTTANVFRPSRRESMERMRGSTAIKPSFIPRGLDDSPY